MKLTTGYKKPIASSGTDALELSSNNSYLLLAGGGHKALSELVSPADLTTELSNYVTIGSNLTITGVKTFSLTIAADISGNAETLDGYHADDILPYGLENLCVGAVKAGYQATLNSDGSITTSGNNSDTYFWIRSSEDLIAGQIYTVGFYVTGVPSGNTETWSWPLYDQTNKNLVVNIKSNGWCWGTGTIPKDVPAGTNILFDDTRRDFWNSINISKFVIVKGRQKAYYTPPISKMSVNYATSAGNADYATTASKLGTASVGSGTQHFYLNTGTATASTSTVGGTSKPMYLKAGVMTAISDTIGSTSLPVYLNAGTITTCTASSVFSDLSNSENDLSITVAGQNRTLTVAYAESAGNAATATNVDWSGITNKPSSLPANGGNADTSDYAAYLRGRDGNGVYFGKETSSNIIAEWNTKSDNRWYLKAASTNQCRVEYADKVAWSGIENKPSSFTPSSHTHTTSEITNFPTIGNGALHIKVNGTELTPEGGIFTANKGDNSTINITVPTAESIEQSTLNKLGDKIVLKELFSTELAKEMAEVMSEKNTKEKLIFKFANPDPGRSLECNPDILSVNYIKVGEYYRLNISGSFVLNGFDFYEQKLQDNYNPVLYSVISGTINNVELFAEKTGMLYFRLSDQQVSPNGAYGPVMFELSVFVKSLSKDNYSNGIYGELNITQFYL